MMTLFPITTYTALYTMVNSPGVVPVTHVDKDLDQLTEEWTSLLSPDSNSKPWRTLRKAEGGLRLTSR